MNRPVYSETELIALDDDALEALASKGKLRYGDVSAIRGVRDGMLHGGLGLTVEKGEGDFD